MSRGFFVLMLLSCLCVVAQADDAPPSQDKPNRHLVGWTNAFVPGAGQAIMGNYPLAVGQAAVEGNAFYWGWWLSNKGPINLDGTQDEMPRLRRRFEEGDIAQSQYGSMLQEFGIKLHMVDTYNAYRAATNPKDQPTEQKVDQSSTLDLFLAPFNKPTLGDSWVFIPMLIAGGLTTADYFVSRNTVERTGRLTPYSNFLYAFNQSVWQSVGSGAPEEMFFRGFLQNELYELVPSPFFSIPLSTLAFAFSHGPGVGRYGAAVSGAYLGYLAHRYEGRLKPGIALHFWVDVFLGIESVLLSHDSQRTTPPTSFAVQLDF